MVRQLRQHILDATYRRKSAMTGCIRRNVWQGQEEHIWREMRGNVFFELLGTERLVVDDPVCSFDVDVLGDYLLVFRAGPQKDYWIQDFYEIYALTAASHPNRKLEGVLVIWENQGELALYTVPPPVDVPLILGNLKARVGTWKLNSGTTPPRISKSGPRKGMCYYCPFKAKCDALDRAEENMHDWPKKYKRGPVKAARRGGKK